MFKKDDPENMTVERMTAMWEHFAKSGEPIPQNNELFKNVTWERFSPEQKRYLEINKEFSMKDGLINTKRMELWDSLFPLDQLSEQ